MSARYSLAAAALAAALALSSPAMAQDTAPTETAATATIGSGTLHATRIDVGPDTPMVLIIAGSGPTDRDGNNPLMGNPASYKMLAHGLAARGISTLRTDKRGIGQSKGALVNAAEITLYDFVSDTRVWVDTERAQSGRSCVWLAGHSEGGLIALMTATRDPSGICGLILIAAPGRPMRDILAEQLATQPAIADDAEGAMRYIDAIAAGEEIDPADYPHLITLVFPPAVHKFLRSMLRQDPAALAGSVDLPILIVQGDNDLQVQVADAEAMVAAQPDARLAIIPGMTHTLKVTPKDDQAANMASYSDPLAPISTDLLDAIGAFVTGE